MKVIAIITRKQDAKAEEFAPYLEEESNQALKMYRDEHVREIYSRDDGKGAIIVFECESLKHAETLFAELPLARVGLISAEFYGARPYRGIVQHIR